jgi:ABC-type Fe3+/spermidine/putrescine transport system ATPase subunit
VFQHLALFPNLTAEANIAFGLQYSELLPTEKRRRLSELISSLQLSECIAKRPQQLSGGQAQRVALARALAPGPEILLLDEPFSSLDRPLADAARALVVRLHRELALTTVLVTHDREQALSVADRIVVLGHSGRIQQISTASDVYENPISIEVARLTGGLNLISGVLTKISEGAATIAVGDRSVTARWMGPTGTPPDSAVKLAFRPEWAYLNPDGGPAPAGLDVLVTQVVQTGSRHHVHCTCGSDELLIETQGGKVAVVGQPAQIAFAAEKPLAYPANKET